jgi:hypothetical protein
MDSRSPAFAEDRLRGNDGTASEVDSRFRGNDGEVDSRLRGNDGEMDSRFRGNDIGAGMTVMLIAASARATTVSTALSNDSTHEFVVSNNGADL